VRETADAQADSVGLASTLDTYGEHLFNGSYPDVQVSGRGNRIIHAYDGAGRLTTTTRNLTSDGSGNGSVVDTIVITREYDQASRLIAQIDDNGNRTEYAYDMLDRRTVARNADGTQKLFFFDRVGNLRITRDERGVVATMTVDVLGRTTGTSVARLPFGPGQTSYETFSYDGASRLVRGENNHAIVELRYDSLGPVLREQQTINVGADRVNPTDPWPSTVVKAPTASYDGVGNRTQLNYPGGTVVYETYDAIDRRVQVSDGATPLAVYKYAGSGYRVLEKQLPQGLTTLYRSYDGDRRVTRHDQRTASTRLAGYSYAWDRVGNRWYERTLTNNANPNETAGSGEAFAYDSAYRMVDYFEGVPSTSLDGLQSNVPRHSAAVTGYTALRRYNLDGVNNPIDQLANGVVDKVFSREGADALVNQITLENDTYYSHDQAGNLLFSLGWRLEYGHRNQLLRWVSEDIRYRHDALGRRVSKRRESGNFSGLSSVTPSMFVSDPRSSMAAGR
jgi:YD repeat-containing protein